MQGLTSKLNALAQETGDGAAVKKGAGKGGDEFSGLKTQLAREVREIRSALKERDELLQKGASGTKQTVQMSHQIRTQIKGVKDDAQKLLALQKKEAVKRDKKGTNATQVEERQEVVELVFKHIEECEAIEKKRYNGKSTEARVELFSTSGFGSPSRGGGSTSTATVSRVPGGTELPDIETQDGLKMLAAKDKVIDEGLDQIAEGVQACNPPATRPQPDCHTSASAPLDLHTNHRTTAPLHHRTTAPPRPHKPPRLGIPLPPRTR